MTQTFIPAMHEDTFDSEASAIAGTRLDPDELRGTVAYDLVGGGRLHMTPKSNACLTTSAAQGQFDLWVTSPDFWCASHEEALVAIGDFESAMGERDWKVFECVDCPGLIPKF